jgi:hypothetical protein
VSLHVTNRAEVVELSSILGDAAREIGRSLLSLVLAPVLAFARYVDRCDE